MTQSERIDFSRLLQSRKHQITDKLIECQFAKQPILKQRYTAYDLEQYHNDCSFHIDFLSQAYTYESPTLFRDYIIWAKQLFHSLRIPNEHVRVFFQCFKEVIEAELVSETESVINQYLEIATQELDSEDIVTSSYIDTNAPYNEEAKYMLALLLEGKKDHAFRYAEDLIRNGLSIQDLYLHIFQTVQYETGRLWHANQISVAKEHYITAATQLIMSQFYARIFCCERNGHSLVAACISGEQHEIGLRMVVDLMEIEGWDTYFLGANTPAESIPGIIAFRKVNLLALSVTLSTNLQKVENFITSIKQQLPYLKVIVGGYPLNVDNELWERLGADGYGKDALSAIAVSNQLVG